MYKFLFVFFSMFLIGACNQKKQSSTTVQEPTIPLGYTDTIALEPKQKKWSFLVNDPSRGRVAVELSNYTDSVKTFIVQVREVGN